LPPPQGLLAEPPVDTATRRADAPAQPHRLGHVGQPLQRVEDEALLRGQGRFADDLGCPPGTLQAAILRSPYPHATLGQIDVTAALALPGVRAVLTGEQVQRWSQPFTVAVRGTPALYALAVGTVRYVGEPVAVVVADSRAVAEDALDLLQVGYRPEPAVTSIAQALDQADTQVVSDRRFRYGDPEAAFAGAPHCVQVQVEVPRNTCTPIECGVVVAQHLPGGEGYEVLSNFMGPFSLHTVMALALQVPGNRLRHRVPRDSGGSFGVKQAVFPYAVLMCLASRLAGAPVKWVEDRLEHLSAATSATARATTLKAAVQADGRITALDWDQADDVGAYLRAPEPATFYRMHGAMSGAYAVENIAVRNRVVLTNKTPTGLVRGFGGPQVYFALERLMDRIAVQLRTDPVELRLRNYVPADDFPYHAAAGAVLDSGDYAELTRRTLAEARAVGLWERQAQARAAGRLYGIGCAAIVEPSISNMGYITTVLTAEQRAKSGPKNGAIASATVAIDPLGGLSVTIASAPAGQGHMTVCAQVVADVFGVEPERVAVNVEFDTAKDAWSVAAGNYSSRFAGAVAGTVHLAAERLRERLAQMVAPALGCAPEALVFADDQVGPAAEPGRRQPFARLAGSAHWAPGQVPEGQSPGLRETAFWTPPTLAAPDAQDRVNTSAAYGFVFDLCGLEVCPDTGAVRVDRYVTGHDAGTLLNPALADGQIRGAFAQGLGAALMEELRYGPDGSFLSGTLADYLLPTACEVPDPVIVHMETPSPFTPLGAKGLGEGNNMSTPVCIANAFADALRPVREVVDIRLPLTPTRVLAWLDTPDPAPREGAAPHRAGVAASASAGADLAPRELPALPGGVALSARGKLDIAAPPEAVFAVLLDPQALALVIPGCHALQATGKYAWQADVTVGVGLVKARYAAQIRLHDVDPPHALRLAGQGTSALGQGAGDGWVRLEPTAEGGTRLHYDYRATVGGKVAMVGSRMLDAAAKLIVAQLFEGLGRQAVGGSARGAAPARSGWWQRLWAWFGGTRGRP
jgi:2-furoyl-CoA dehydrogenase large subunit